jgi:hypothetical protein
MFTGTGNRAGTTDRDAIGGIERPTGVQMNQC